jgi:D-glycero-alpha-D-manno-heptose-7-phosphate kinase
VCLFWYMPSLVARAPTRIDFGGGWTDVPPYANEQGGVVCNLAITRYATVHLHGAGPDDGIDETRERALADAALRVAALPGVRARLHNDFPLGAGLGGSSAAGVAMMGAIEAWRAVARDAGVTDPATLPPAAIPAHLRAVRDQVPADRSALAEASRRVEVEELHIAGGRQDHYAAAYGGALSLAFGEETRVHRLALTRPMVRALEARCVVVYTGQSRISGDTIAAVLDAYAARETRVLTALARMKALAEAMADALVAEDVDALGMLVGEHWVHQRALHPSITTPLIDRILDVATAAGAIGGKALGASGGGCVLLVAAHGFEEPVRRAVESLATPLPFSVDQQGLAWWPEGDPLPPSET